jgi:hypothetical protein
MFAEEHAGNASRKRSKIVLEDKVKQQERKQHQNNTNDQAGSQDADAATPTSPPSAVSTVPAATATGVTPPKQVTATNPLSAVERPSSNEICAPTLLL